MELSDVFNQDVNKYATAALSELQAAQKNELANQYQSLQNDRYGQVTPYEVAQQRLAGLRANEMGDPDALRRYKEGTLGQFDTQALAARQKLAVEKAGINPELEKAQTEQLSKGIEEVTQMFAAGHTPQSVYEHIAKLHGKDVADYYAPVIKQGVKGVTGFHNYLLQNNPAYRQHIDQAAIGANATVSAANARVSGNSLAQTKLDMKRDADVVKNAKALWNAKVVEMQGYTFGSKEYKKAQDEASQLANEYAKINKAFEAKYNNLTTTEEPQQPSGLPAGVTIKK